jgi:hypothetical protein
VSGLPVTMCGLNVTHQALDTPLARICVDLAALD